MTGPQTTARRRQRERAAGVEDILDGTHDEDAYPVTTADVAAEYATDDPGDPEGRERTTADDPTRQPEPPEHHRPA